MNIKEFIDHFSEQFDNTTADMFKPETLFKELDEWTSLTALSIISMIDEEYDVSIGGADIRNANTIKELYKIVESKK